MKEEMDLQEKVSPERALVQGRVRESMVAPLVLAFTNIFYVIILFLAWYIPADALMGVSIIVGVGLMTVLMFQVCVAGYDENHVFMQGLLVYFPVNAKRLRHELFLVMWKYVGIQAGITCVPMLVMALDFRWERFVMTLSSLVLSMVVTGVLIILGSMSKIKAEM